MEVKKVPASNKISSKMPSAKKKSILQQVMKPKDWAMIGILIVVSGFCWVWVLNAYEETISVDDFINSGITANSIDKSGVL